MPDLNFINVRIESRSGKAVIESLRVPTEVRFLLLAFEHGTTKHHM